MAKHLNRWTTGGLVLLMICGLLAVFAGGELRRTVEWVGVVLAMGLVIVAAWKTNQPDQSVTELLYQMEHQSR